MLLFLNNQLNSLSINFRPYYKVNQIEKLIDKYQGNWHSLLNQCFFITFQDDPQKYLSNLLKEDLIISDNIFITEY